MRTNSKWHLAILIGIAMLYPGCKEENLTSGDTSGAAISEKKTELATLTVFAGGLNNPRGLKFGPDGYLYVAEGGTGGTTSTAGQCVQVPAPVGPYTGSTTGGRISKISTSGERTTLTDQLPSATGNPASGGSIVGVGDIAFCGTDLYALITAGGCSHGVPSIPTGVAKVNASGTWEMIADLSSFVMANPVKNPEEHDFEPDGDWYSMIDVNGSLYAVEANQGQMVRVTTRGNIKRIIDISASQGHIVPTVVAYWDGNFYVGNLNPFPIVEGSSNIYKITPKGEIEVIAKGFSTILGLDVDKEGNFYVLENTVGAPFPTPELGRITMVSKSGEKKVIASGLSLATGLTIGPDGNLYVSNVGFGPAAIGGGQIIKVELKK
jgi:hypothetical protein